MTNTESTKALASDQESEEEFGVVHTVATRFPLASIGLRCGAFLLDYILTILMPAITVSLALMFRRAWPGGAYLILASGYAATIGLLVLNWVYLCGNQGQTVGKRIIGIRIVRTNGAPLDYKTAALRHFAGYLLSFLALGLGVLWMMWDAKQQGWHDKLADTLVVKD